MIARPINIPFGTVAARVRALQHDSAQQLGTDALSQSGRHTSFADAHSHPCCRSTTVSDIPDEFHNHHKHLHYTEPYTKPGTSYVKLGRSKRNDGPSEAQANSKESSVNMLGSLLQKAIEAHGQPYDDCQSSFSTLSTSTGSEQCGLKSIWLDGFVERHRTNTPVGGISVHAGQQQSEIALVDHLNSSELCKWNSLNFGNQNISPVHSSIAHDVPQPHELQIDFNSEAPALDGWSELKPSEPSNNDEHYCSQQRPETVNRWQPDSLRSECVLERAPSPLTTRGYTGRSPSVRPALSDSFRCRGDKQISRLSPCKGKKFACKESLSPSAYKRDGLLPLTLPKLVEKERGMVGGTAGEAVQSEQTQVCHYEKLHATQLADPEKTMGSQDQVSPTFKLQNLSLSCVQSSSKKPPPPESVNSDRSIHSAKESNRPSIVQERIHDLLAASGQSQSPSPAPTSSSRSNGSATQHALKECFSDNIANAQKVPPLQVPVSGQFRGLADPQKSPLKSLQDQTTTSGFVKKPPQGQDDSPTKPAFGDRGHNRRPENIETPRPLLRTATEQRSGSPTRSSSERSRSEVRVRVEVRGSPERFRGGRDSRMVLVRASVEPDDGSEGEDANY